MIALPSCGAHAVDLMTVLLARWRGWRLRHRFATEAVAVIIAILAFITGGTNTAPLDSTMPPDVDIPPEWVIIALDAPPALELAIGDAVIILADGIVMTDNAQVAGLESDGAITVAMPIADAGPIAAVDPQRLSLRARVRSRNNEHDDAEHNSVHH